MASSVTAPDPAQKLTPQELEQARLFLQQTQGGVTGATKGLSQAQWKFKPAPDRWSVLENLYHIVVVLERVLGPVLEQVAQAPPPPAGYDARTIDAIVINQFPNRLAKFSAPEAVHPAGEIRSADLLNRLSVNFARLAESLESRSGLRGHALPAPPLKAVSNGTYEVMDGYQWILAAAAHTERHTKQMLEVKADAAFPAN